MRQGAPEAKEGYYDFDARYLELEEMGREIERLRAQEPSTPELEARLRTMAEQVEEGWRDLAQEILKREG
jgi:hypothetical protein